MTQPQPIQPRPTPPPQEGSGLSQKIGPLPAWGWIGIAAAGGIVLLLWLQRRNSSTAAPSTSDTSTGTTGQDYTGTLATLESQIRDLQGANSQPVGTGTPVTGGVDRGIYYFGINGDADPSKRYIGIPGVGYYWVPDIGTAQQFLSTHPTTVSLGQIDQGDATTRFGPALPWSQFGAGGGLTRFGPVNGAGSLGGVAKPLGAS